MVNLSEKPCHTPPSEGVTNICGVCDMKISQFCGSFRRSHLDPQIARPAMSNSRQSRALSLISGAALAVVAAAAKRVHPALGVS